MASGLTVRHQHGPLTGFHPEELEAGTGSGLQPVPREPALQGLRTRCAFPLSLPKPSKPFDDLFQTPFGVTMHPPSAPTPHCTARHPKNLQRPTKRRHPASPEDKGADSPPPVSSRPGHFIPRTDTLGAISYELFSARLWPCWGPGPRLLPGLRIIAAASYGKGGRDLRPPAQPRSPPLPRLGTPTPATSSPFTGLLYRGPRGPACRPPAGLKPPKTSTHPSPV